MTFGKDTWAIWARAKSFFPIMAEQGRVVGISIHHFCFDRAIQSALQRRLTAYVDSVVADVAKTQTAARSALLPLTHWCVGFGCANHDSHNGLKWSMQAQFANKDLVSNVFIGIESLRNSYFQLCDTLPRWLARVVDFTETPLPAETLRQLWTSLGIEPDVCDTLVELGAIWMDNALRVSAIHQASPDWFERLSASLLGCWRFVKFSDSRWVTIGRSARTMVAAYLTGIESLVQELLDDRSQTKHYINGFKKVGQAEKRFLCQVALGSYPSDGVLQELLEDDRVCRRCVELEDAMREEMSYLASLPAEVYSLIAALADRQGPGFKSDCLQSGHVSCAFSTYRFFKEARQGVWGLLQGVLDVELTRLQEDPAVPLDDTLRKIKTLLNSGYPRGEIVSALELLRDVSWSTASVEQQHGSAAMVSRLHTTYGANMMQAKAHLHAMRQFYAPTETEQALAKAEAKLKQAELAEKHVSHITGRRMYAKAAMELAKHQKEQGTRKLHGRWQRTALRLTGASWAKLSDAKKAEYEAKAKGYQEKLLTERDEARAAARQDRDLALQRQQSVAQDRQRQLLLSQARFDARSKQILETMWAEDPRFTRAKVSSLREQASLCPAPPIAAVRELMEAREQHLAPAGGQPCPDWARTLCLHRDIFKDAALFVHGEEGVVAWKFVLGFQSPMMALFTRLEEVEEHEPLQGAMGPDAYRDLLRSHCPLEFRYDPMSISMADELGVDNMAAVEVLTPMAYLGDGRMGCHNPPVPWAHCIAGLPQRAEPRAAQQMPRRIAPTARLLEEHPWLQWLPQFQARAAGAGSASGPELEPTAPAEASEEADEPEGEGEVMADEKIESIFAELEARRAELHGDPTAATDSFRLSVLGGPGTLRATGKEYDAYQGRAAGREAESFCALYGLQKTSRYSTGLFGDAKASLLGRTWCAKMQHYFDVWRTNGGGAYVFTAADVAAFQEPGEMARWYDSEAGPHRARIDALRKLKP